MTGQVWILILAVLGGAGGLAALLKAIFERPKVKADAILVITESASIQIKNQDARIEKLEARLDTTVNELDQTRDQLDETDRKALEAAYKANALARYQRRVSRWWEQHYPWDMGMQAIANLHDPEAVRALPPLQPFPQWEDEPS